MSENQKYKYNCPVCDAGFDNLQRGGYCAFCKARLKRDIVKLDSGKIKTIYVLFDPAKKPLIKPKTEKISAGLSDYELVTENQFLRAYKHITEPHMKVYYFTVQMGWIYCQHCMDKMFMNMTLKGQLQEKCKKCKTITDFYF